MTVEESDQPTVEAAREEFWRHFLDEFRPEPDEEARLSAFEAVVRRDERMVAYRDVMNRGGLIPNSMFEELTSTWYEEPPTQIEQETHPE